MSLQEIKEQAYKLSVSDRLALISALVQSLQDSVEIENWQYLITRPHPWRKQLYVKGHKLLASTIWQDMVANQMSPEQAAENWDLPQAVIDEVIRYCESHQDLLKLEADEERCRLEARGVSLSLRLLLDEDSHAIEGWLDVDNSRNVIERADQVVEIAV